jgi:hypothetical protein
MTDQEKEAESLTDQLKKFLIDGEAIKKTNDKFEQQIADHTKTIERLKS